MTDPVVVTVIEYDESGDIVGSFRDTLPEALATASTFLESVVNSSEGGGSVLVTKHENECPNVEDRVHVPTAVGFAAGLVEYVCANCDFTATAFPTSDVEAMTWSAAG